MYYFRNIDAEICRPLDYFLKYAKKDGLETIKLVEAIRDLDTKEFIWCSLVELVAEREDCTKAECEFYTSTSGRGVCKHRGRLYYHGDEITFNVETGKKIK